MKINLYKLLVMGLLAFNVSTANATLEVIGSATFSDSGATYNLIYDEDLSLVWLDYSKDADIWINQLNWAKSLNSANLVINLNQGLNISWLGEWRLPTIEINPSYGYYRIDSEMGHLFYKELMLLSYPERGNLITNEELNSGPFNNLIADRYWTDSINIESQGISAWDFLFHYGYQSDGLKGNNLEYGLAVRPAKLVLESDVDSDGIPNETDNCVNDYNPNQQDTDYDRIGDVCDSDVDGDNFTYDIDCNDYDPSIHPDACDVKNDGIDQDCDGQDRIKGKLCRN